MNFAHGKIKTYKDLAKGWNELADRYEEELNKLLNGERSFVYTVEELQEDIDSNRKLAQEDTDRANEFQTLKDNLPSYTLEQLQETLDTYAKKQYDITSRNASRSEFEKQYTTQIDEIKQEIETLNELLLPSQNDIDDYNAQIATLQSQKGIKLEYAFNLFKHFDVENPLAFYSLYCLIYALILCILFPIYMYPTKVARKTEHDQTTAIAWLNFFFGGTIILWIVLLIWATSKKPQPVTIPQESSLTDKLQEIQKLKDQGLLTDEEFEAKKKQILNL